MSKRKLIRCEKCNKPIAEMVDNKIQVLRSTRGETSLTEIEVRHNAGGEVKISCENCGENHFHKTTEKTLGLTYCIAKK